MDQDLIPAKIKAIYLHPTQKVPVVFLADEKEEVVLPMVIGFLEAQAILIAWQSIIMPRPMTIDLLKNMIEEDFGASIERVVVRDIKDGAFFASLVVTSDGRTFERDCRPSDAVALAVRTKAPIFLSRNVLDSVSQEAGNTRAMLEFLEKESEDNNQDVIKF